MAPDEGYVVLSGNVVFDESGAHADEYRTARCGIGAVFQHPEDQIVTTVTEDDVAFGPENLAIEHDEIGLRISGSLDAVDMSDYRASDPTRMSGGQQQRIAIAGMLAMDSDVLVLDEPTAMLDPQGRADIMRVLDELQDRGTTIILVTHHADELEHADRVIQLEAGHIVGDGPADERLRMPVQSVGLPKRIDDEPAETLIEARDISYRYVDAERDVFNHLSFSIGKGETVALMGRNGAGKTTLARMLCALEKPTTGSIVIDGIAVATAKANGGTKPLNRKKPCEAAPYGRLRHAASGTAAVRRHRGRRRRIRAFQPGIGYVRGDGTRHAGHAAAAYRTSARPFAVRPVGRPAATGGDRRRDRMRAESVDSGRADRRS